MRKPRTTTGRTLLAEIENPDNFDVEHARPMILAIEDEAGKATVDRIRAAWTFDHKGGECEYPHEQFDTILDAEAAR